MLHLNKIFTVLSILLVFAISACKKTPCENAPSVEDIQMEVTIERLDQEIFKDKSAENLQKILARDASLANLYFIRKSYPHDSVLINKYLGVIKHPSMDTLYQQVQATFGDMNDLKADFKKAFQYIKYYYPEFKAPKIKTVISGFSGMDMLITDSVIVLSLDYFLGPKAAYVPDLPSYILKRFQKQYMVPMVVLLISGKYNAVNMVDKSLLSEMIHYGKAYQFAKTMLPCVNDTLLTGYSKQETIDINFYEDIIWANFVQNKLLFKTDQFMISRFVGESPSTQEIGEKCPGRIGRWVGWKIVQNYADKNSKLTINELMKETDIQKIFEGSGYRPEKKSKKQ